MRELRVSLHGVRTFILDVPAATLSWIGRQGTRAVAALIVIGIAAPPIGALLKPFVTEAVFVLLCIAFLRLDAAAFKAYLRRPAIVIAATAWTSLGIPALFAVLCTAFGMREQSSELFLALMLQGIASPLMAAPALAALMELDAALVLVTLVTSTALIPFTAALFSYFFIGPALTIAPLTFGAKLLAILAGSALVGLTMRRIAGPAAILRHKESINGFNSLVLFIFVAAFMESVATRFLAAPMSTLGISALAFAIFLTLFFLTFLAFLFAGRERALALGFMVAQRNMGLMLAATGGALPELAWLYFALSQFPIYLSPQLLKPLVRRMRGRTRIG